jgi:hypothetical protein
MKNAVKNAEKCDKMRIYQSSSPKKNMKRKKRKE